MRVSDGVREFSYHFSATPRWLVMTLLATFSCQGYTTSQFLNGDFLTNGARVAPTLIVPSNNGIASIADSFVWSGAADARSYKITLSRNADMSSPVLSAITTTPLYAVRQSDLLGVSELEEQVYYWRVSTNFRDGTLSSQIFKFTLYDKDIVYANVASSSATELGTKLAPFKSLQPALNFAEANGRSKVYVAKGDYTGAIQLTLGVTIMGGYDAATRWSRNVASNLTRILNGTSDANVYCTFGGTTAMGIDGFTIVNTKTTGTLYGVRCISAGPTISNNTFTGGAGALNYHAINASGGQPAISSNTINVGSATSFTYGIYADGASPTITNNSIAIASSDVAIPIYLTNSAAATITGNTLRSSNAPPYFYGIRMNFAATATIAANIINGPQSATFGGNYAIEMTGGSTATIINNMITAGATGAGAHGIYTSGASTTVVLLNNSINGGDGGGSIAYGVLLGAAGSIIRNNIIFSTGSAATRYCVTEQAGASPASFANNNLFGCTVLYRDEGATDMINPCGPGGTGNTDSYHTGAANVPCNSAPNSIQNPSAPTGNISINNTGNQLFIDIDGPDNIMNTLTDNDWRLTTNPAICNVRGGGLNLSAQLSSDRSGLLRTIAAISGCSPSNTGAANWSMGAHETD